MNESENAIRERIENIALLRKAKKYEEAIDVCNEIIADDDNCFEAYRARSRIFHELGQHKDSFRDLDKLISLRPTCPSVYMERAAWSLALGNDKLVIDDANFAISTGEEYFINMAHFYRSIAFLNLGNKEAATADCLRLPESFKTAVTTYNAGWKVMTRDDLYKMINP